MNLRMIIRLPTMTIIEVNEEEETNTKGKNREYQGHEYNRWEMICTINLLSCREREQFQWVVADETEGKLKYGRK